MSYISHISLTISTTLTIYFPFSINFDFPPPYQLAKFPQVSCFKDSTTTEAALHSLTNSTQATTLCLANVSMSVCRVDLYSVLV